MIYECRIAYNGMREELGKLESKSIVGKSKRAYLSNLKQTYSGSGGISTIIKLNGEGRCVYD